ncbi:hypothetical protein F4806DRAFT_500504 [Annulohypoxylon nitens]|nr:hypothetical protein F4806DRAFT_500504 [Annulohypoxylon nitens]
MLPEFLSSSYGRYKSDTNAFVTWLGRAADACGYKTKAHTIRDATSTKYFVSTQELVSQINAVYQSKVKFPMPDTIKNHLKFAIEARQRCSNWFDNIGNAQHKAEVCDNGGHKFFINVLEDALVKLGGERRDEAATSPTVTSPFCKDGGTIHLQNRFAHLTVDDTDDSYYPDSFQADSTKDNKQPQPKSIDTFELEAEKTWEKAFAVFCFFEDMQRIREKLQGIWRECNSGNTLLPTASVITTMAIHMIRKAEQDLFSAFLPDIPDDISYQCLAELMFLIDENKPNGKLAEDFTPFDEFIFKPSSIILLKSWPPLIVSLEYQYIDAPYKVNMPEHKKFLEEDQLLTQLLLDSQLPELFADKKSKRKNLPPIINELMPDFNMWGKDIFLESFQPMWLQSKLSATTVIAARILLDIIDICKELPRFQKLITYTRLYTSESLEHTEHVEGKKRFDNLAGWNDHNATVSPILLMNNHTKVSPFSVTKSFVQQIGVDPPKRSWKDICDELRCTFREALRDHPGLREESIIALQSVQLSFIRPSLELDFAVTHNLSHSGSRTLKLLMLYHKAGLSLANYHMSIFGVAHLYNALRQLKLLDQEWQLMEHIIELHKRALFADVIPKTLDDIWSRLKYRISPMSSPGHTMCGEESKGRLREAPQVKIFEALDLKASGDVLAAIEEKMAQFGKQSAPAKKSSRAGQRDKKQLSPDAFIGKVQDVVAGSLSDMSIDYVRLTRRCVRLLDDFRAMWNVEMLRSGVPDQFPPFDLASSENHLLHAFIRALKKARENTGSRSKVDVNDLNNPERYGVGLSVANKVFKMFLKKENTDFRVPLALSDARDDLKESPCPGDKYWDLFHIQLVGSGEELRKLLSSTTYVIVNIASDLDFTPFETRDAFLLLSADYHVEGIMAFVRVYREDALDLFGEKTSEDDQSKDVFAFFKDGKRVKVNGNITLSGHDKTGLEAAAAKLGGLAKKRQAVRDLVK